MSIEARTKRIIADQFCREFAEIKLESKLVDDLGADSLDSVELVLELEDEFDIEISDPDAERFVTVQDVTDYIAGRLA